MTEASMRHGPDPGRSAVGLLAGARLVSVAGSQAAQVALVYTIYQRTRSPAWVSAALFALVAITGLLGPISGWIGDRFDRRRVMITSELAAGVVWVGLLAVDAPWLLVALALAATAAGAPFRAASAATIPNLVDDDDLTWANGIVAGSFNAALVVGPLAGGALVAASGADAVYMVNAGSYVRRRRCLGGSGRIERALIGCTPPIRHRSGRPAAGRPRGSPQRRRSSGW